MPAPAAEESVGPVAVNEQSPEEPSRAAVSVIVWLAASTLSISATTPPLTVIPTVLITISIPGIKPDVVVTFVIVAEVSVTVPLKFTLVTEASSRVLSTTSTIEELTVVVVPLTVKLPPTVISKPIVALFGITTSKLASPRIQVSVPEAMTNCLLPVGLGGA